MPAKKRKSVKLLNILLAVMILAVGILYVGVLDVFHLQDSRNSHPLPSEGALSVTLLDTGNSDCSVVLTPQGQVMMIDAGETDDFETISAFLDAKGIGTIDVFVLTHPHADHIGSASKIIENYRVKKVIMSPAPHTSKLFENLLDTIEEQAVPVEYASPSLSFHLGSAAIQFLSPIKEYGDLNNMSAAFLLTYGKNRFLFTGDIEQKAEKDIYHEFGSSLKCDVLKVPHHGSETSSSKKFLSYARPTYALIPCDEDNEYGHPHAEAVARLEAIGAKIYRTDLCGSIICTSDGSSVSISYEGLK